MNFQNCRVNIITNRVNRRRKMVNVLTILRNSNNGIDATLLRLPSTNENVRHKEKVLNPNHIHGIREVIFGFQKNVSEPIEYLGMDEEQFNEESRAYATNRQVNLENLDNNYDNYYIITISQEYFDGLMA